LDPNENYVEIKSPTSLLRPAFGDFNGRSDVKDNQIARSTANLLHLLDNGEQRRRLFLIKGQDWEREALPC